MMLLNSFVFSSIGIWIVVLGNNRRKIVTSMMCYLARDHQPTLIGQLPFPKQITLVLEAKFQPRSQIFKSLH